MVILILPLGANIIVALILGAVEESRIQVITRSSDNRFRNPSPKNTALTHSEDEFQTGDRRTQRLVSIPRITCQFANNARVLFLYNPEIKRRNALPVALIVKARSEKYQFFPPHGWQNPFSSSNSRLVAMKISYQILGRNAIFLITETGCR